MERNSNEVVRSQSRMLAQSKKSGADISENHMAAVFDQQAASIKKHLTKWRLSVFYINYQDCIFNSINVAQRIDRFLGGGLDVSAMSGAVRPELYRERYSCFHGRQPASELSLNSADLSTDKKGEPWQNMIKRKAYCPTS